MTRERNYDDDQYDYDEANATFEDDFEAYDDEETTQPKSKSTNGLKILLALLMLALIGGALLGTYLFFNREFSTLKATDSAHENSASQTPTPLEAQVSNLQNTVNLLMQTQQDNLSRILGFEDNMNLQASRSSWGQRDWMLAEVHYLVQMASDRLAFMRDYSTAAAALQNAINRLDRLADPSLNSLRQQLFGDLQQILQLTPPDPLELIAPLETLINNLQPLPLQSLNDASSPAQSAANTTPESLMETVKNALSERVRVIRHDQPLNALDKNTVPTYQLELLRLHLAALRLSLLQNHQQGFLQELNTIDDWVSGYLNNKLASPIQAEITKLRDMDAFPAPPSLETSVSIVRALLTSSQQQPAPNNESDAKPEGAL